MCAPALTAALLFLCCASATATTYVVSPDGAGDFPTIQSAIGAATNGDVIVLTDGTFTGDGNRDIDYLGKAITVRSQSRAPESCVIDCGGSETDPHRGFRFRHGEQAGSVLSGVSVRGGWATYPDLGGALYADRCAITIVRCRFAENEAASEGGAIFAYGTLAKIAESEFVGNASHAAAAASFHDESEAYVIECLFEDNASSSSGGALTFWISGPNLVDRCTFVGNTAAHEGAALWAEKISSTFVRNCTFWGNGSPDGTVLAGNYELTMVNTVVAFSTQGPGVASNEDYVELACCDVFGNEGGDWVGAIADQYGIKGNISADPLFCDPVNGDLHIDAASPCVPFSPVNPECDLVGAWPVGCGGVPVAPSTWGATKAMYR